MINSGDSLNDRMAGEGLMDKKGQRGRWWGWLKMFPRWSCKRQLAELCMQPYDCLLEIEQAHHRLKSVAVAQSNPCAHYYNHHVNVYVYLKIFGELNSFCFS